MIFSFDDFELDADKLELRREGAPVKADPLVLRLLAVLVRQAGQLVSKQTLLQQVWDGRVVADNVITVSMVRLRRTLGHRRSEREFVNNVHGRGYRFVVPVTSREGELAPLLASPLARAGSAAFVGRERVVERLRVALRESRAGRGRACVLIGEPGIGKTRAVETLAEEAAAAGVLVAWGYCREAGDTPPLWPMVQLVRAVVARIPSDALRAQLSGSLDELSRFVPELLEPGQPAPEGAADAAWSAVHGGKHRMFDAIMRVFTLAAQHTPCVLVLDDLHRGDPASLELLRCFIDEIARSHVLLLATLRKSEAPLSPTAQAHLTLTLGHRNCERIALERLRADDVAAYVASVLDDPSGALGRAVFEKSEGNPFFMVELSRQLRDAGRDERSALELPFAALELVRQRVARLDDDARGVLSCAAVIGRSFELPVLQAISERGPSALMASLDDALASEVVVAAPDSRTAFAFGHDLLRAALYDAIPPGQRRRLHLLVAQALEQRREAGDSIPSAELAYHFHAALPETDLRKAVHHCDQASIAAALAHANEDVVRHAGHALEALDLIPDASPRLRMRLLQRQALHARLYSARESERYIGQVQRAAREQKAGIPLASAALLLGPNPGFPAMPGSRAALEEALHHLPEEQRGMRGAVLARLCTTAPLAYSAARSAEQLAQAMDTLRDEGPPSARYAVLAAQLYLTGGPAQGPTHETVQEEFERMCRQHPVVLSVPPVLLDLHRAIVALQRADFAAMRSALDRAEARCRVIDSRELLFYVERCQALAAINAGDAAGGSAALRALYRRLEHDEFIGKELFSAYDRIVVLGDAAELLRKDVLRVLHSDGEDPPNVLSIKVRALAAAGLVEEARAALRLLPPQRLSELPCDRDYLGTLGHLAHGAIATQELDHAEALHALLAPYPESLSVHLAFRCEGSVAQVLGALEKTLGRRPQPMDRAG